MVIGESLRYSPSPAKAVSLEERVSTALELKKLEAWLLMGRNGSLRLNKLGRKSHFMASLCEAPSL